MVARHPLRRTRNRWAPLPGNSAEALPPGRKPAHRSPRRLRIPMPFLAARSHIPVFVFGRGGVRG